MARPTYYEPGPNEGFGISVGDYWWFDIVPERNLVPSDRRLNGVHLTRLAAIEKHIANLEEERAALNRSIARAKRLRRAWSKEPQQ